MQSFNRLLEELSFIELKKDLEFGDLHLPRGLNLPLYTESLEEKIKIGEIDFSTKEILEGVLTLFGADPDFRDRRIFKELVAKLQPLLPFLYQEQDPYKALVMALGLINLEVEEKGIFLFAAERCNDLIRRGEDYTDLALGLLELEEESWPVFYHRGFIYYNREDYLGALEQWQRALDYELPTDIRDEIYSMMAQADKRKYLSQGKELLFKERYQEAKEAFATILGDFPHWYELYFYYGLSLRFLEEYTEALSVFLSLLQLRKDDVYLYNEIAICHLFLEEPQEAVGILGRGLALADNPDLRLNLAISYYQMGDSLAALEELERAKSLAPDDGLIHHWESHIRGCDGGG